MDMYNIVMGDGGEQQRGVLLACHALGVTLDAFGRYRDCWAEWDENQVLRIAVYTRNGGGNRADYEQVTNALRAHPLYMDDRDDEYDVTYATYYFRVPVILPDHLRDLPGSSWTQEHWDTAFKVIGQNAQPAPIDMSEQWKAALNKLQTEGLSERQAELSKPLIAGLEKALDNCDPNTFTVITTDGDVRKENL